MVRHLARCDEEFGRRISEGVGLDFTAVTA
jgi:hypothetical protein